MLAIECHLGLPLVAWLYTSLYDKELSKQDWKKKRKERKETQPTN